jgi:CheY-like chemotaxis protein
MRKLRVNVFDDDVHNLKLLELFMTQRGYEVMTFDRPVNCSLYDGQPECNNSKPCADIIITDHQMPRMTGLEMLLLHKQRGCKTDIRNKALISGDPYSIDMRLVEELGCSFFSKPLRLGEFFAWLDECEKRVDLSKPIGILRKEDRYSASIDIEYAFNSADTTYNGIVMNYGVGGLCLKANIPLSVAQSIVINDELPNGCKNASVRWVQPMETGFYMAGLTCTSRQLSPG